MSAPDATCPKCGEPELSPASGWTQIGGDGYGGRCCAIADAPVLRECLACNYVEPWELHPENRS